MDKIKAFFSSLLQNKKLLWIIGGVAALLVIAGIVIALLVGGSNADLTGCTVEVKTEGGMALEGIGVYIYTDATKAELVSYAKTNEEGVAAITEAVPKGGVAILDGVPAGYVVEESYPITAAETKIVLSISLLEQMSNITLGGVMFDFTVTATDGTSYTLSELLKEKKAVVLNLWYTTCEPCKAEFPYLQQAYDLYSSDIAVLALNPVSDDDEAAVAAFQNANGLTIPMAKCDAGWANLVQGIAYPTTVVIDRFGTVALIHTGSIDNAKTFTDAFAFFAAEDYVQTTVENISDLATDVEPVGQGTKESPMEFGGVTEFDVTVEPSQTVYCNVYRVSGMALEVQSESLQVTYGETVYEPVEGMVCFMVNTPDPTTPALIAFTNPGTEAATYKVTFIAPEGSVDKPIELKLGDFTTELLAGNTQGVYYTYTTNEEGSFTIMVKDGDNDAEFGIALNNLSTSTYKTLEEDGTAGEESGTTVLAVDVKMGQEVQVIVSVIPDENGNYPAASIKLNASVVKEDAGDSTGGGTGGGTGSTGGGSSTTGTLINPDEPIEIGGTLEFQAEVGVGEMVLYHVYRVSGTTLCLYDADAYVIYNGKTYTPNSSGDIYISVSSDGPSVPIVLKIGNSGSSDKTFDVYFYYPQGSQMNPYDLTVGEMTTNVSKGNEQGVYYTYTATAGGTITVDLLEITSGVKCDIVLYNERSYKQVSMNESNGATSVSIEVREGDVIQVIINTLPDDNFNYPAATIKTKFTIA